MTNAWIIILPSLHLPEVLICYHRFAAVPFHHSVSATSAPSYTCCKQGAYRAIGSMTFNTQPANYVLISTFIF